MAGHGRKDTDEAILLALAAGGSTATAAEKGNCSERTVRRRLADPAFRQRISAMRSQLMAETIGRLATLGKRAADELDRLLLSGENDNIKLGAARAVLTYMLQGHEHEVLGQQIEELQAEIEELKRANGGNHQQPAQEDARGSAGDPPEGDAGNSTLAG
jgi:hypothetical protein